MTSKNNKIDFFSKNPTNKREMTSKRKYIKSGKFTKEAILKRKMGRIFVRSKKLYDEAGKSWNQKLENIQKSIDEMKKKNN